MLRFIVFVDLQFTTKQLNKNTNKTIGENWHKKTLTITQYKINLSS